MPNPFSKLFEYEFFQRTVVLQKPGQIIWWWEKRRFWFNFVVGFIGVFTCLLMAGISLGAQYVRHQPIGIPDPSSGAIITVLVYGIMANLCYTSGWIAEILVKKIWRERAQNFGRISFALGVFFSILLTLLPAAVALIAVLLKLL